MTNTSHDLTCQDVERRFEALLEGRLESDMRVRIERHFASCPTCRDLAEVAGAIGGRRSPLDTPDLTGAVLARTAGTPCGPARDLLCDFVDGALASTEAELVAGHAARCASCGATATALEALRVEMRQMAVVEPDPRFVRDVMRATLGPDARWRLVAARLTAAWANLVTRPRFGLEASYVGAMILFALFALPFSPLRGVSERALAFANRGSVAMANASSAIGRVPDRVATLGDRAWDATGAQGVESLRVVRRDISSRYERTEPARQALREDGVQLRKAAREGDLPGSRDALQEIGTDLGEFVRLISVAETPETENENRPLGAGRG